MCGIAGAIREIPRRPGSLRPEGEGVRLAVRRISGAQAHRGPDGAGFWQSAHQEVVFAHRRLAILDLSEAGAQPMSDRASGCAITFNGEIYNFQEIRRELEARGETFRSSCDTEVILKAYARWGIDAVGRFRGIFAFALWDPRSRVVHLVRDPMGIKPLYWTLVLDSETGEEVLFFSSELRALLASGRVSRHLAPAAVASYLWQGFVVGPGTIVRDVQLLPPASIMTVGPGSDTAGRNARGVRRYWEMPGHGARTTTASEVREELAGTVRMQLVADVPLGVFLSGGVDSSAVASLASEVAPESIHTFTVGFDVAAYDERCYAKRVADSIGSRHTAVVLTEGDFLDQLPQALGAIDQPTFDAINTYFVSRAARNAGMTVALAGTGGDELFGGYRSYRDLPRAIRQLRWLGLSGPGRQAPSPLDGLLAHGARFGNSFFWNILRRTPPQTRWGKVADALRSANDVLALYQTAYSLFTRESQATLASDFVRAAQAEQSCGLSVPVAEDWRRRAADSSLLHAVSLLELSSFVGERLLRDTDAASMAVSLEVRVPLLDHRLIESVAGLDPDQRFQPLGRKQLLRDLALARLDASIFDRPKSGFVLPIDAWARRGLQPDMAALLSDGEAARRTGLSGRAVQILWRSFVEGRLGLYWSRVWAVYVLMAWCRAHDVAMAE